jgi:hypothetical protein
MIIMLDLCQAKHEERNEKYPAEAYFIREG